MLEKKSLSAHRYMYYPEKFLKRFEIRNAIAIRVLYGLISIK